MKRKITNYLKIFPLALLFLSSCKKDVYTSEVFIVKQWRVYLSTSYMVPGITGRTDHAVAMLFLMDNNELHYDIYFDQPYENGDSPTSANLYLGQAAENGSILIDLKNVAFNSEREVKGSVPVTTAQIERLNLTLPNNNVSFSDTPIYLQVNSTQQPNGLVRGQIDKTVKAAFDVDLDKYASTVNTAATGKAYFRIMADGTLVYNVAVGNVSSGDALTTAHVHNTASSSILMTLAATPTDYNKVFVLPSSSVPAALTTDLLYVDVHSTLYPAGLLKGTIR